MNARRWNPARLIAIGDVHGYLHLLTALWGAIRPTSGDHIVMMGDYIDRGPDGPGVIQTLAPLHATGNLTCLRGNHEQMMEDARQDIETFELWMANGGDVTLARYGLPATPSFGPYVPPYHWWFLTQVCVDWFETPDAIFVHGGVRPDQPLAIQSRETLLWQRFDDAKAHSSGKLVVCGHTTQASGRPAVRNNTLCVDTGVFLANGRLTAVEVRTGEYWQVDHHRQIHRGSLAADPTNGAEDLMRSARSIGVGTP